MVLPETGPGEERPLDPPAPPPPPPPPRAPIPVVSPALAEFHRGVRELTPRGFVTEALIAVNVLVYVVMVARGVDPMKPLIVDLLSWGAGYGPRTTGGEWWRLFTATFLHIGALHLAMNMYVLWSVGRLVERMLGNVGFLVLYVSAGLAGSVASVLWSPYVVSAGASGAVFGVYGGLLGFLLRERRSVPREALDSLQRSAVLFLGYNLVFGMSVKGVDMAAHLGGLAGGFVGGLVLAHPLDAAGAGRRWLRNAVLAAGTAATLLVATRVMPRGMDLDAEIQGFSAIEKRFNHSIGEMKAKRLSDKQLSEELDGKILPEYHAARLRLLAAHGLPEPQTRQVAAFIDYMSSREEAFRLVSQALVSEDPALVKKANEKQAEADRLLQVINDAK